MAEDPPRELVSLIKNHIDGFNTQNVELFLSVFSRNAIIIDGTAPYRWLNPNAPAIGLSMGKSGVRTLASRTSTWRTRWASGPLRDRMHTPS